MNAMMKRTEPGGKVDPPEKLARLMISWSLVAVVARVVVCLIGYDLMDHTEMQARAAQR